MLVLTRRVGESIRIGDDILIKVIQTGNQVAIGIDAPDDVNIVRAELLKTENCKRGDCDWVSADNEHVKGAEVCLTCKKIRPANVGNK